EQQIRTVTEMWTLESYQLGMSRGKTPQIVLSLRHGEEVVTTELACGDGPVDAIFLAVEEITGIAAVCKDFRVHSVTVGRDAQGEVTVQLEHQGELYRGRGVSTDSLEASAKAF